jgi:hypothetical protein
LLALEYATVSIGVQEVVLRRPLILLAAGSTPQDLPNTIYTS